MGIFNRKPKETLFIHEVGASTTALHLITGKGERVTQVPFSLDEIEQILLEAERSRVNS